MELTLFNVQISSLICHESRLRGSMYHVGEEATSHSALATLGKKAGEASSRRTLLWDPLLPLWHLSFDPSMGVPLDGTAAPSIASQALRETPRPEEGA